MSTLIIKKSKSGIKFEGYAIKTWEQNRVKKKMN